MKTVGCSETLSPIYQMSRCNIPNGHDLYFVRVVMFSQMCCSRFPASRIISTIEQDITPSRNVWIRLYIDAVSHPERTESSGVFILQYKVEVFLFEVTKAYGRAGSVVSLITNLNTLRHSLFTPMKKFRYALTPPQH